MSNSSDKSKPCHTDRNPCSKCCLEYMWWNSSRSSGPMGPRGKPGPPGPTGPTGPPFDTGLYAQRINENERKIDYLESIISLSDVVKIPSAAIPGLGVAIMRSGCSYVFWGIDCLSKQQSFASDVRHYLITSSQYSDLKYYRGDATVNTLWIIRPGYEAMSYPLYFNARGIYFILSSSLQNVPVGSMFRFTQTLILVPPERRQ